MINLNSKQPNIYSNSNVNKPMYVQINPTIYYIVHCPLHYICTNHTKDKTNPAISYIVHLAPQDKLVDFMLDGACIVVVPCIQISSSL